MSKTITINGTDRTSVVRLAGQVWAEVAERGAVGIGGLDLSDEGGAITVPAMKAITVDESAASPVRLFTGYTAEPGIARGPYRVGTDRSWDVDVFDINTLLDDRLLLAGANRPEETDYARVTWLLTTTAMTGIGVTAGVVPNTNTVTMDAVDYRGATPRRVLDECAEMAGKNFFLYRYSSGPLLYYDLESGTSLTSTARFSTVAADVDSATTWAVAIEGHTQDTGRIYSRLRMTYANGSVWVTNASTASTYRQREISFTDKSIKTEAKAVVKANKYLAAAALPTERFTLMVRLPAANVNHIRAGQRAEVKIPHLGISSFTYYRCVRREIGPAGNGESVSDVLYDVRLEFAKNAFPTRFREQHTEDENTGIGGGGTEVGGDGGGMDGGSGDGGPCDDCDPWNPDGSGDCRTQVYDNWNRTVAANGWGDATPGGNTWSNVGGGAAYAVDGARGYIESTAYGNRQVALEFGTDTEGPWSEQDFDMRLTFRVEGALGALSGSNVREIRVGAPSGIGQGFAVRLGDGFFGTGLVLYDDNLAGGLGTFVAKTIALDTDYIVRWDRRGAGAKLKMWPAASSEPAKWDIIGTEKEPYQAGSGLDVEFSIRVDLGNGSAPAMRVEFDDLTFTTCTGPSSGQEVGTEEVGVGDASTTTFNTDFPFKRGSLKVYVDGVDVTSSISSVDPGAGSFTLDFAPLADEAISVDYVASGRQITGETIGGGDGSTVAFTTEYPYVAATLTTYVDGVSTAQTETNPDTGAFTFGAAPAADTIITADYRKQ